jgi:hypothetical protein
MSEKKEESKGVSRRQALKYGAAAAVVAAAAAGGYYYTTMPPTPTPTATATATATATPTATSVSLGPATLRYYGVAFVMYQDAATEYQKETNGRVTVQFQGLGNADASSKALATGGEGWDITSNATARLGMLTNANPPVLQPIDVEKIPNWTNTPAEGLASYIYNPEVVKSTYISEDVMGRLKAMLFKDGVAPEWNGTQWVNAKAWGVGVGGNFEGIAYLPDFLPYSEEGAHKFTFGYEEKFNPEWKGHVGMQDDVTLAMGWGALMLTYLNQAKFEGFDGTNGKLTKKDIDTVINYLTPFVQGGQIRTFAADYGSMLAAMTSREVYIMQTWQPVVNATRAAGIPSYWARTPHGGEFWWSPDMVSIKTPILQDCINWLNWRMAPWWVSYIVNSTYFCWRWNTDDLKQTMGYEKWGWQYNGDPTYKSKDDAIKDIWPDKPEFLALPDKLKNGLFVPDMYHWNTGKGTPDPNGILKDHGAYEDCMRNQVGFLSEYPDNIDYMVERWNWLKSQLKR